MKIKFNKLQTFFIVIYLISTFYILFIKSELFESNSTVIIKNINNSSPNINSFAFLLPNNNSIQDIYVIQSYISSYDELLKLDKKFQLKKHYHSKEIDFLERLKPWSTKEDFLNLYKKRLEFIYDQTSGLITIGFLHTNPKIAYEIVKQLIQDASAQLNKINKILALKQLEYIKQQVKKNKKILESSIKQLEKFQNSHNLLDPTQNAQSQFALLSQLQTQLINKETQLNELSQYMNPKNFEIIRLKNEIINLKNTIKKIKKNLTNKNKKALNAYIYEFESLKSIVELNKELYKQSLLQLEKINTEINKNSKILLKVTNPYISQGYKYPEKLKDIITITLIILLFYGIISLIKAIIKEHID